VGASAKELELSVTHDIGPSDAGRWLWRKDSNLRIRDPKSRALPLGHAPGQNLEPQSFHFARRIRIGLPPFARIAASRSPSSERRPVWRNTPVRTQKFITRLRRTASFRESVRVSRTSQSGR